MTHYRALKSARKAVRADYRPFPGLLPALLAGVSEEIRARSCLYGCGHRLVILAYNSYRAGCFSIRCMGLVVKMSI